MLSWPDVYFASNKLRSCNMPSTENEVLGITGCEESHCWDRLTRSSQANIEWNCLFKISALSLALHVYSMDLYCSGHKGDTPVWPLYNLLIYLQNFLWLEFVAIYCYQIFFLSNFCVLHLFPWWSGFLTCSTDTKHL